MTHVRVTFRPATVQLESFARLPPTALPLLAGRVWRGGSCSSPVAARVGADNWLVYFLRLRIALHNMGVRGWVVVVMLIAACGAGAWLMTKGLQAPPITGYYP